MIIIITGTGTNVGKTVATAAVAAVLAERGHTIIPVKPVQTGEPEGSGDVVTVGKLTGLCGVEFFRYPEPLAPNVAARRAGLPPTGRADIANRIRALDGPDRIVLVEGAGGLLVRLAEELTIADIAADLDAPLLVVTSLGLGSLNAAELTVEVARSRGLRVLGLIGGSLPAEPDLATQENLAELPRVTEVRLLGCLPAGAGVYSRGEFADCALRSLDLKDVP